MPPFPRQEVLSAETMFGAPFTAALDTPAAHYGEGASVEVPDDIRSLILDGIIAARQNGEGEDAMNVRRVRNQLQILHNLELSLGEQATTEGPQLRDHQKGVIKSIYDFESVAYNNDAEDQWGYVKLPTATGKTAIFTWLVDKINKPLDPEDKKLKSLVLVPNLDLVPQTIGKDSLGNKDRGFAKFAADTTVSEYHGKVKDLSGDAVVMTYRSFNKMVRDDKLPQDLFDIMILDEVHNALGKQVQESVRAYGRDKFVLGLSATTEYGNNKKVDELLPTLVHTMKLREAIEERLLSPVRGMAIRPDAHIETLAPNSEDYTDQELQKLIYDTWRNEKGVEFAGEFVKEGKQGVISCVPGEKLAHARLMADEINEQVITDKDGVERNMRAVAVGSHIPADERQVIYEAYERGEIDVLTYVDVLTEGWDSTRAKFLINLCPTTSPVKAVQRIGRILRPDGDEMAYVVEFIDRADKPQYTFFHALEVDEIDSRHIHGSVHGSDTLGPDVDLPRLSPELLALIREVDHRMVAELIVQPQADEQTPEGVKSLVGFGRDHGIVKDTVTRLAEELGIETQTYPFGPNHIKAEGLTREQQQLLLNHPYFLREMAPDGIVSLYAFGEKHGYSRSTVETAVDEMNLDASAYRFGSNRIEALGLTETQQGEVLAYLQAHILDAPEGAMSAKKFYIKHHSSLPKVYELAAEMGIEIRQYRVPGKGNTSDIVAALTQEQQALLLAHEFYQLPPVTEDVVLLSDMETIHDLTRPRVQTMLKDLGITLGRYRDGGRRKVGITKTDYDVFEAYFTREMPELDDTIITLGELAEMFGTAPAKFEALARERGIVFSEFKQVTEDGTTTAQGITVNAAEQLIINDPILALPALQADQFALEAAAKKLHTSPQTLLKRAAELGISPQAVRLNVTKEGTAFTSEQLEIIAAGVAEVESILVPAEEDDQTDSVKSLEEFFGVYSPKILSMAADLGIEPVYKKVQGRAAIALTHDQQQRILAHEYFSIPRAGEHDALSLDALQRRLGVSKKKLMEVLGELGIEPSDYIFGEGKGRQQGSGLDGSQIARVEAHEYFRRDIPMATEEIVSLGRYATESHMARPTVLRMAEAIGIVLGEYRFGQNKLPGIGLTQQQREALEATRPRKQPS